MSTLTDISQFLSQQNNQLDSQLETTKAALGALTSDLDRMQQEAGESEQFKPMVASIAKVKEAASVAWQKHVQSTNYMRQIT